MRCDHGGADQGQDDHAYNTHSGGDCFACFLVNEFAGRGKQEGRDDKGSKPSRSGEGVK